MSPPSQHPAKRPGQNIDIGIGRTRDEPKHKDRDQASRIPPPKRQRGGPPSGAPAPDSPDAQRNDEP